MQGLPLAAIFLAAAYGIYRQRAWSAYGGALLMAAMTAGASVTMLRTPVPEIPASVMLTSTAIFGSAVLALFLAGRHMPAAPAPASRAAWIALAVVFFVSPQFCRAYVIASGSMENTMLIGDQVLVRPFSGEPARGEVVQHRYPVDPKQSFLKRVVAIGGDRVRLRDKQLIVNGTPVNEPYVTHRTGYTDQFRDNFPAAPPDVPMRAGWVEELRADTVNGELVVPAGKYFVLGDNRDESLDSRYFGFLERADLVGKPVLIYFSAVAPPQGQPVLLHPSRIRWERIFKGL